MASRIILHLGSPKTGTSFIETIIWSQREQLARDGVFLPGKTRNDHDALMGAVLGPPWQHPNPSWTWERVAAEGKSVPQETILISKEMLAGASATEAAKVREILQDYQLEFLVTSRKLDSVLVSNWQQIIKAGREVTFADWFSGLADDSQHRFWAYQNPRQIFQTWAPEVSPESLTVLTVPASGPQSQLWDRYAQAIGVPAENYQTPTRQVNASLGLLETELLRRINQQVPALKNRPDYLKHVQDVFTNPVLQKLANDTKINFPAGHHAWLVQKTQTIISDINNSGCRIIGNTSDLMPSPETPDTSVLAVSADQLTEVAVTAIANLLTKLSGKTSAS